MWTSVLILVGCILVMVNISMRGFPIKLLKTFALSLGVFFKDLLKEDMRKFRGYGFTIFVGLGGTGKTLSMVNRLKLYRMKYPRLKIYTNFDCLYADGKVAHYEDLVKIQNIQNGINEGVVFALDEIHMTFNSKKWKDAPDDLLYLISQNRKRHVEILATAQNFENVNIDFRRQCNTIIECHSGFWGRFNFNKWYKAPEYIANGEKLDKGAKKRKPYNRVCFVGTDMLRNSYDTEQLMYELSVGGRSTSSKLHEFEKIVKRVF